MHTQRGVALIFIILIVVALGGVTYAVLPKSVLKDFFQKGDKPTQEQFKDVIDSSVNLQDDRDLLGLKKYDPTQEYLPGDTTVYNNEIMKGGGPIPAFEPPAAADALAGKPASAPTPAPMPKGCVSNPTPVFTHHITDLSKVNSIVPPPTMGAGPSLKTHSYINSDHARMPVYAPMDLTIKAGSHYVNGPYMFDFWASCEVTVRFGHMTEPIDAIKRLLPAEPTSDSRTQQLSGVSFKAGELVGFTTGTSLAGNWDFGVYNSAVQNRYAGDPEWGTSDTYTTAVCPFDYFSPQLKEEYRAKLNSSGLGGNPPHGESFCR